MALPDTYRPKLRSLDAQNIVYEGMSYLHLRDPLALSGKTLLIPQPMIPLLTLLDGTRDVKTLQVSLAIRFGLRISLNQILDTINSLDEALFLVNEHYWRSRSQALADMRASPCRPSAIAGESYPKDAQELRKLLQGFINAAAGSFAVDGHAHSYRGLVSPHIDYARGGDVYARVWSQAAESLKKAELVILLGTDHFSEGIPFTLTRQNYCSPLGELPTDQAVVDRLTKILGEEQAFNGEIHHRSEHSIELASVWLQFIRGGNPVKLVPILCGSLSEFEDANGSPGGNPQLNRLIDCLKETLENRRVVVIAAGDMAHVGPAFGGESVTPGDLILLRDVDAQLIASITRGDAEGFYQQIRLVDDRNNVCGVSPIYLAMRILDRSSGLNLAYSACPADVQNTSYVSICGVVIE
jgi:AmmeMemoRadiSam system protein B